MRNSLFTGFLLLTLLAISSLSLPFSAEAATFAKQSLFLSKAPVTEGETVLIHAVVANDSNVKFTGDVVFKDADQKIGTVAVTIAPGGAQAVSISWKPGPGAHPISAQLTAQDGSVVESESQNFSISEKPKPVVPGSNSNQATTSVGSSADIQKKITDLSPAAGNVAAPIFSTLDSVRARAAQTLDSGINWAKQKASPIKLGSVLGSSTQQSGGTADTAWSIFGTILLYILTVLRYVVGNAGVFYPVFALLFFYLLWRIYKRMRRPSYESYE
jgi:hypothetical protein